MAACRLELNPPLDLPTERDGGFKDPKKPYPSQPIVPMSAVRIRPDRQGPDAIIHGSYLRGDVAAGGQHLTFAMKLGCSSPRYSIRRPGFTARPRTQFAA